MNRRDVAMLLCVGLGVLAILWGIHSLRLLVGVSAWPEGHPDRLLRLGALVPFLLSVTAGAGLIAARRRFAAALFPEEGRKGAPVRPLDLAAVGIAVVGILLIGFSAAELLKGLSTLIAWTRYSEQASGLDDRSRFLVNAWITVGTALVRGLIGVGLAVKARSLARYLIGPPPASPRGSTGG
jgi:hypothetical protein